MGKELPECKNARLFLPAPSLHGNSHPSTIATSKGNGVGWSLWGRSPGGFERRPADPARGIPRCPEDPIKQGRNEPEVSSFGD